MQTDVTQAENNGGGWVVLVMHSVCNGCDTASISPSQLTSFLDWLQPRALNGTVVKTVGEVMGGGGPPVPVPDPRPCPCPTQRHRRPTEPRTRSPMPARPEKRRCCPPRSTLASST